MNFLLKLFYFLTPFSVLDNPHFTGLRDDTRTEEQKQTDYLHEERNITTPTDPFSNPQLTESPYPYQNQNQTSECVPHGAGLALAIERADDTANFSSLAPTFPYRLRSNLPDAGSIPNNILSLYAKYGAPLATSLPTPLLETSANNAVLTPQMYTEAEIFRGREFYTIKNCKDMPTLGGIAQAGHAIPFVFYSTEDEWARQYPVVTQPNLDPATAEVRHCACILPKSGFMKDGKRYFAVQDSAFFGGWKMRYVSEDFIQARVFGAWYWDTVNLIGSGQYPRYTFTKVLKWGSTGPEVKAMQQLLVAEGLLPNDCITGNFFGRTLAGVNAFQVKHSKYILTPLKLDAPTGIWGASCAAVANTLCPH